MQVIHERGAGLDVHKKTVPACVWISTGKATHQTRTFPTMTADLLALSDWLQSHGVTHVAMEPSGAR